MAATPPSTSITVEAFADAEPDTRKAFEKLALVLNPFLSEVTSGLDRRLTIGENLAGQLREISFTAPADWAASPLLVTLDETFPGVPKGSLVLSCINKTTKTPKAGVSIAFLPTALNNRPAIRILDVSGVTAGQSYTLWVWVIPGA